MRKSHSNRRSFLLSSVFLQIATESVYTRSFPFPFYAASAVFCSARLSCFDGIFHPFISAKVLLFVLVSRCLILGFRSLDIFCPLIFCQIILMFCFFDLYLQSQSGSFSLFEGLFCGNSSVGRAQPCQGWGREFESRFPLRRSERNQAIRSKKPYVSMICKVFSFLGDVD